QTGRLFTYPPYRGFGLYTAVNPDIARNCPELADPRNQPQLSEYGAMLHLWRNPELDPDLWIGFTSYRQLDKFRTVFQDRQTVETLLQKTDVLAWGLYQCVEAVTKRPISILEGSEWVHPGITLCLARLLWMRNESLPKSYCASDTGAFANYWVMSRRL